MATETMEILIKPFNGLNYTTWKVQCNIALIKEGLWNIATGKENAPENQGEQAKYLLRRYHTLATIVLYYLWIQLCYTCLDQILKIQL